MCFSQVEALNVVMDIYVDILAYMLAITKLFMLLAEQLKKPI